MELLPRRVSEPAPHGSYQQSCKPTYLGDITKFKI